MSLPRRRPTAVLLAAVAVALVATGGPVSAAPPTGVVYGRTPPSWPEAPPATARSYLLVDAATGQTLAGRSPDELRPVASTVKILTILTALRTLHPDDLVTVGPEVTVGGAGVGLAPGDTWTVEQLLEAIIVRSGNDAARALAVAAAGDIDTFVADMREVAADLGVDDAVLASPTGLDDENRLSATDLATFASAALQDPDVRAVAGLPSADLPGLGVVPTRNLLVGTYPGITGLKTGYTDAAGYCLVASAARDGHELIAVVLGAREDQDRFDEAAALLDYGFDRLVTVDTSGWRVRRSGGWRMFTPAVPWIWVPRDGDATVVPALPVDAGAATMTAAVRVGDTTTATVTATEHGGPAGVDGVGVRLADAVYAAMRVGHTRDLWPAGGGADAASAGLG